MKIEVLESKSRDLLKLEKERDDLIRFLIVHHERNCDNKTIESYAKRLIEIGSKIGVYYTHEQYQLAIQDLKGRISNEESKPQNWENVYSARKDGYVGD